MRVAAMQSIVCTSVTIMSVSVTGCCMYILYAASAASMQALGNTCLVVLPSRWQFSNGCAKHTYHDMHNCHLQIVHMAKVVIAGQPQTA